LDQGPVVWMLKILRPARWWAPTVKDESVQRGLKAMGFTPADTALAEKSDPAAK